MTLIVLMSNTHCWSVELRCLFSELGMIGNYLIYPLLLYINHHVQIRYAFISICKKKVFYNQFCFFHRRTVNLGYFGPRVLLWSKIKKKYSTELFMASFGWFRQMAETAETISNTAMNSFVEYVFFGGEGAKVALVYNICKIIPLAEGLSITFFCFFQQKLTVVFSIKIW